MSNKYFPKKLKIGLLLDSYEISLWQYTVIEKLKKLHFVSIQLVVLKHNKKDQKNFYRKFLTNFKFLLFNLYNFFDQFLFSVEINAFKLSNSYPLLQDIKTFSISTLEEKNAEFFKTNDIKKIKNEKLDVLIRFGFGILKGDILECSKHGIWSYHHGDTDTFRGAPSCFWEVFENNDITGVTLQILSEKLDGGQILTKSFSSTNKVSVHRNRNIAYWKSTSFISRQLERLYEDGNDSFNRIISKQNELPKFYSNKLYSVKNVTNFKMLRLLTLLFFRTLTRKLSTFNTKFEWSLLYLISAEKSPSLSEFKLITPEKNRFYADPFVIQEENQYFIFFEDYDKKLKKGSISYIQMDSDGTYKKPINIIDKPYHLSFPSIVKENDSYYLIPESRSNRTIEIYKCMDFPSNWEFVQNLFEDLEAVDTVLFNHKNKWWLFTNIVENKGASSLDELFLFYSDSLISKEWVSHPNNPIVSDVRRARSAGNIFIQDEMIFRPSQDSSKRYGHGIKLNQIMVLNESEYEEKEVDTIYPNWDDKIVATHTINSAGYITVIDGLKKTRFIQF